MSEISESLKNFILDNFVFDADASALTETTDLKEGGILDSLGILRLIAFIEDRFHVQLELEDVEALGELTLGKLETLVVSHAPKAMGRAAKPSLLRDPSPIDR